MTRRSRMVGVVLSGRGYRTVAVTAPDPAICAAVSPNSSWESIESLSEDPARTMRVLTRWAALARHHLPPVGSEALRGAEDHWLTGETVDLDRLRIACWQYLDRKNGTSVTIDTDEDRAVRAVICCLYDDPVSEGYEVLHFMLELLTASGVDERALDAAIGETP